MSYKLILNLTQDTKNILYTQKQTTRTMTVANMKDSSWKILTSFNILSFTYEHFLSKLSPAMDMDKFWAYTDNTPHKHKTIDMAMCRLLFSRYLKGEYWVGTSLFNCLATSTKVFVLTKSIRLSIISSLLLCAGIYLDKNFFHYKTCMKEWRWIHDLLLHMHCLLRIYICVWNTIHATLFPLLRPMWIYGMQITGIL